MNLRVRHKVRSLDADDRGNPNVGHFMSADIPDWFLPAVELTVACVEPAGPEGAPLTEPRHQDGGGLGVPHVHHLVRVADLAV